jgi:hypothetical protein
MRIARFGDRAAGLFGAAGTFGRDEAGTGHHARRGWKTARVTEFGSDGEGGEVIDAAEAAQAFAPGAKRFDGEEVTQFIVDGADVGTMRLLERR